MLKFTNLGKVLCHFENPYPNTYFGNFSYVMLIMNSWIKDWKNERVMWENDPHVCTMVSKVFDIFNKAWESLPNLQNERELRWVNF